MSMGMTETPSMTRVAWSVGWAGGPSLWLQAIKAATASSTTGSQVRSCERVSGLRRRFFAMADHRVEGERSIGRVGTLARPNAKMWLRRTGGQTAGVVDWPNHEVPGGWSLR